MFYNYSLRIIYFEDKILQGYMKDRVIKGKNYLK